VIYKDLPKSAVYLYWALLFSFFFLSLKTWKGYLRVFQIELIGFSIFFIGNLGMRFIGLFDFWNFLKTFFKNYFCRAETVLCAPWGVGIER